MTGPIASACLFPSESRCRKVAASGVKRWLSPEAVIVTSRRPRICCKKSACRVTLIMRALLLSISHDDRWSHSLSSSLNFMPAGRDTSGSYRFQCFLCNIYSPFSLKISPTSQDQVQCCRGSFVFSKDHTFAEHKIKESEFKNL